MATDRVEAQRRGVGRTRSASYFAPDSKAGARMRSGLSSALSAFSAAVQDKALRSAVFAGAKVLSAELTQRVPVDEGTLKGAIYHWHDDARSVGGKQVYAVGVNKRIASHWFNVEYGHWRVNVVHRGPSGQIIPAKARLPAPVWTPARPYLRPTWDAKATEAVRAMQRRLIERIRELAAEQAAS